MNLQSLDQAAVERLTTELLVCVRAHYLRRPQSRATAQEILNAAAIIAATIIHGARDVGDEAGAREFFDLALESQLEGFAADTEEAVHNG